MQHVLNGTITEQVLPIIKWFCHWRVDWKSVGMVISIVIVSLDFDKRKYLISLQKAEMTWLDTTNDSITSS
jgi:hypothetical protein